MNLKSVREKDWKLSALAAASWVLALTKPAESGDLTDPPLSFFYLPSNSCDPGAFVVKLEPAVVH